MEYTQYGIVHRREKVTRQGLPRRVCNHLKSNHSLNVFSTTPARVFRIMDDDGSKSLDFDEFKKGLRDYGLSIEESVSGAWQIPICSAFHSQIVTLCSWLLTWLSAFLPRMCVSCYHSVSKLGSHGCIPLLSVKRFYGEIEWVTACWTPLITGLPSNCAWFELKSMWAKPH